MLATGWQLAASSHDNGGGDRSGDPVVAIWHKWQAAHQETQRLCRKQEQLERKLIEMAANIRLQAYRDFTDHEFDYSAARHAEREMGHQEEHLLKLLSSTPATSIAGVIAKLDAILIEGQPSKNDAEFPWPQIRSVLQDIIRLSQC